MKESRNTPYAVIDEPLTTSPFLLSSEATTKLSNIDLMNGPFPTENVNSDIKNQRAVNEAIESHDLQHTSDVPHDVSEDVHIVSAGRRRSGAERSSTKSRLGRRAGAALLALSAFTSISVMNASKAEAGERHVYSKKQGSVKQVIQGLDPGDKLLFPKGTYDIGGMVINDLKGTSNEPITISSLDKKKPALLRGGITFNNPEYLKISNIRVEGIRRGSHAFAVAGGKKWSIVDSEFFNAKGVHALAVVAISSGKQNPKDWNFSNSCVHDASTPEHPETLTYAEQDRHHLVYINIANRLKEYSNGRMSRNILYGAPSGSAIKIGAGAPTVPEYGGSGIKIDHTTAAYARHGILAAGKVAKLVIEKNLTAKMVDENNPVGIHLVGIADRASRGDTVIARSNYAGRSTTKPNDMKTGVSYAVPENKRQLIGKTPEQVKAIKTNNMKKYKAMFKVDDSSLKVQANPNFDGIGCGKFKPQNGAARGFGRYAR
ncbi:MAG TPA: hypothetical protein VF575_04030 [Candidatus Saccharimonadales bacterium]|jgi:hypothetical protein